MRTHAILLTLGILLSQSGCATVDRERQAAREMLQRAVAPFQEAPYVRIDGNVCRGSDPEPQSFLLLMGTESRFLYRCGQTAVFSDGKYCGRVDYDKDSTAEGMVREVDQPAGAMIMSVGMAQGPYHIALARASGNDSWLDQGCSFYQRQVERKPDRQGGSTITLHDEGSSIYFVITPEGVMRAYGYRGKLSDIADIRFEFLQVEYPEQIAASAFRPAPR